jgi:hypothetical protein
MGSKIERPIKLVISPHDIISNGNRSYSMYKVFV